MRLPARPSLIFHTASKTPVDLGGGNEHALRADCALHPGVQRADTRQGPSVGWLGTVGVLEALRRRAEEGGS